MLVGHSMGGAVAARVAASKVSLSNFLPQFNGIGMSSLSEEKLFLATLAKPFSCYLH